MLTNIDKLKELYQRKLVPNLVSIDHDRKQAVTSAILAIVIFVMGILLIFAVGGSSISLVVGLVALLGTAFLSYRGYTQWTTYRQAFKKLVIKEVFKLIDPDIDYRPKLSISQSTYKHSKLFLKGVDRYQGDDYAKGKVGKTDYEVSELHTQYETRSTDSKGNSRSQWHTIFQGIFLSADFHKHIQGETIVLPDFAENVFGKWFGQGLQGFAFGREQLVKLEDPEFEKHFVVYANDQVEARYILTPDMMKRILALKEKFNRKVHLSFMGSRIYIAISMHKNRFEPSLFVQSVNYRRVLEFYSLFSSILGVIEELNLNTRIWTKR